MYLRFRTKFVNEEDRPESGIFQALSFIRDHKLTDDYDEQLLKGLSEWFSNNLEEPTWYSDEKREFGVKAKAICWFKDSAKEHIQKINELIVILEKYNLIIERIGKREPGHIVYQDEFQIVAIPLKSEAKKVH